MKDPMICDCMADRGTHFLRVLVLLYAVRTEYRTSRTYQVQYQVHTSIIEVLV